MIKTSKTYRHDLAKYFGKKKKDSDKQIKWIQDNPNFLDTHKKAVAIQTIKDDLYKELDAAKATQEYLYAKNQKQEIKQQEELITKQKKLLVDKKSKLATMNKTSQTYRHDLAKYFGKKKKNADKQIKWIQDNPNFLDTHKKAVAIQTIKDDLYKELDAAKATQEYLYAKTKKQEITQQKKDSYRTKKLLADKKSELATMNKEYASEANKEIIKQYLFNKPNMTPKDKELMKKILDYLVEKKMDTSENLKKLKAIKYGPDYIRIAGVKFSRKRFIPKVIFDDKPNYNDIFESNTKGIYKTMYHGNPEYFLTIDQYINQAEEQGIKTINDNHIRQALQALPGEFSDDHKYHGANILGTILDLSTSGCITCGGTYWRNKGYGYLNSASLFWKKYNMRIFKFDNNDGVLNNDYTNSDVASPCLFRL